MPAASIYSGVLQLDGPACCPGCVLEFSHRVGSWKDVVKKARHIRASGGITVHSADKMYMEASVAGDHDTYDVKIYRQNTDSVRITHWSCRCEWGQWAFKRQHTFVGRTCSHALACYWEMRAQDLKRIPKDYPYPEMVQFPLPGMSPGRPAARNVSKQQDLEDLEYYFGHCLAGMDDQQGSYFIFNYNSAMDTLTNRFGLAHSEAQSTLDGALLSGQLPDALTQKHASDGARPKVTCSRCGRELFGGGRNWRDEKGSPFCWMNAPDTPVHQPVVDKTASAGYWMDRPVAERLAQTVYYHGTWHKLPVGTVLVPSGSGASESNWAYEGGGFESEKPPVEWGAAVWICDDPGAARDWGQRSLEAYRSSHPGASGTVVVYRVEPMGPVRDWWGTGTFSTSAARIIAEA